MYCLILCALVLSTTIMQLSCEIHKIKQTALVTTPKLIHLLSPMWHARTHARERASVRGAQCSGLFVLIWSGLGLRLTDLFSGEMSLFVPPVVNHHSVAVYNFCGLNPRHI